MLNSIHLISNQFIPLLQEKITYTLTESQKRIVYVAAAAFALITACYLAYRCFQKPTLLSHNAIVLDDNDNEKAYSPFEKAIDLMFHDRRLEWGRFFSPRLTTMEQAKRHDELKKAIAKIPSSEIDNECNYREGMSGRTVTLLVQAIIEIKNPAERQEIVQMLLDKGADPRVAGEEYGPLDPLTLAKKKKDAKLIQLLEDAIAKFGQPTQE